MTRNTISWAAYLCSALPFLFIFGEVVQGVALMPAEILQRDVTSYLIFNGLVFVPAGWVSLGVRNLPCNLTMAGASAFIVPWMIRNWPQRDSGGWVAEGWGWLDYYYCLVGILVATLYFFYLFSRWADKMKSKKIARNRVI